MKHPPLPLLPMGCLLPGKEEQQLKGEREGEGGRKKAGGSGGKEGRDRRGLQIYVGEGPKGEVRAMTRGHLGGDEEGEKQEASETSAGGEGGPKDQPEEPPLSSSASDGKSAPPPEGEGEEQERSQSQALSTPPSPPAPSAHLSGRLPPPPNLQLERVP